MRFLSVVFWMRQAQRKKNERKKRRRDRSSCKRIPGHAANSRMTVIRPMPAAILRGDLNTRLFTDGALSDETYFQIIGVRRRYIDFFWREEYGSFYRRGCCDCHTL